MTYARVPPREVGMLFQPEMVRAIIERSKWETRRLYKPDSMIRPRPGNYIWVREAYRFTSEYDSYRPAAVGAMHADRIHICYEATPVPDPDHEYRWGKLRPSIFLPRWASRITLPVASVWFHPLQEITAQECIHEGIEPAGEMWRHYGGKDHEITDCPIASFRSLWDSINQESGNGWDTNPTVCAIRFRQINFFEPLKK